MAVGTVSGVHPALELLSSAVELTRKAASMLSADEVWSCSSGDIDALLCTHAQLESVTAAVGLSAVREVDIRGLAAEDGKATTASWLAKKLTLHPGEAKARVKAADMLSRKAPTTMTALVEGRVNPHQAQAIARGLIAIESHASAEEFHEPRPSCSARASGCTPGTSPVWPATSKLRSTPMATPNAPRKRCAPVA